MKVICTVKDVISATHEMYMARTTAEAVRIAKPYIDAQCKQLGAKRADFEVYEIGTFNEANGEIKAHEPKYIGGENEIYEGE